MRQVRFLYPLYQLFVNFIRCQNIHIIKKPVSRHLNRLVKTFAFYTAAQIEIHPYFIFEYFNGNKSGGSYKMDTAFQ